MTQTDQPHVTARPAKAGHELLMATFICASELYVGLWLDGQLVKGASADVENEVDSLNIDVLNDLASNLAHILGASFHVSNLDLLSEAMVGFAWDDVTSLLIELGEIKTNHI